MKLKIIFTLLILVVLSSCCGTEGGSWYKDSEPNKFVVVEVRDRSGMQSMTTYKVRMLDESGLGTTDFWMVDTIGKYNLGDALILTLYNE